MHGKQTGLCLAGDFMHWCQPHVKVVTSDQGPCLTKNVSLFFPTVAQVKLSHRLCPSIKYPYCQNEFTTISSNRNPQPVGPCRPSVPPKSPITGLLRIAPNIIPKTIRLRSWPRLPSSSEPLSVTFYCSYTYSMS